MPSPLRVLLVDDHPFVRKGVSAVLGQEPGVEVVGEAETAAEALDLTGRLRPDLVVLDLLLQDGDGADVLREIKRQWPACLVVVLSGVSEEIYAERLLRAGASGFVSKAAALPDIVRAVRTVRDGGVFVSEAVSARLLRRLRDGERPAELAPEDALSDRELQVFGLLGEGLSHADIAERLTLSVKTVESHVERIRKKLGVPNGRTLFREAVLWTQRAQGHDPA